MVYWIGINKADEPKMAAMDLAQIDKGFDERLSNNKAAVQLSLSLLVVEVPAVERGGIVYLSFDAGSIRAVQVDRPESNSRQGQYVMVVVIDASRSPLCSNPGNPATEAGLIDLVVLLVAA